MLPVTACEGLAGCDEDGERLCVTEREPVWVEVALCERVVTPLPVLVGDNEANAEVVPLTDAV